MPIGMMRGLVLCTAAAIAMTAHASRMDADNKVSIRVETESIPAPVHYEFSRSVGAGRLVKSRDGKEGAVQRTFRVVTRGKRIIKKELVEEKRIEPVSTLFLMGRTGYTQSRGRFERSKVLTMNASGYDPSPATIGPSATGRTATGMRAEFGIVAVDPRVIPLGTLVFVEGYGFAIAADKGSAIKGNKIDLCFTSRSKALEFGRRDVRVHVLRVPKNAPKDADGDKDTDAKDGDTAAPRGSRGSDVTVG